MKENIMIQKSTSKSKLKIKYALCLLTFQPPETLIQLFNDLYHDENYHFYVIVDDNHFNINSYKNNYKQITFINNISEEECYKNGFHNANYFVKDNKPSAWDKALYYFSTQKLNTYEYLWFIEDDVFIPQSNTIHNINMKYKKYDLLVKNNNILNKNWGPTPEVINHIHNSLVKNTKKSMVCALRFSNTLLSYIKDYATQHKKLFFIESLFNTLANIHNLTIKVIPELSTIKYRHKWNIQDINPNYLYHPLKLPELQLSYRKFFQPNTTYSLLKNIPNLHSILKNNKPNTYLHQIYTFQYDKNKYIQIIQNNNEYFIQHKEIILNNQDYIYSIKINSWNEAYSYILNLQATFVSYQTILIQNYIYNNTNIDILNIPSIYPFVRFQSHNHQDLLKTLELFSVSKKNSISYHQAFQYSNDLFNMDTNEHYTLIFKKIMKAEKYISKNKKLFHNLIQDQLQLYHLFIQNNPNTKIRNNTNLKY